MGSFIVKYILDWLVKLAFQFIKKESKVRKDKATIDDQVVRVDAAADKAEAAKKRGEEVDVEELINASRELARNF